MKADFFFLSFSLFLLHFSQLPSRSVAGSSWRSVNHASTTSTTADESELSEGMLEAVGKLDDPMSEGEGRELFENLKISSRKSKRRILPTRLPLKTTCDLNRFFPFVKVTTFCHRKYVRHPSYSDPSMG